MTNAVSNSALDTFAGKLQAELFHPKRQEALARVLPAQLTPERFAQTAYAAIVKNPDLVRCTLDSLIVAIGEAAEIGMPPTGALNRAFLVPFRDTKRNVTEAKLVLGYAALEDLAKQSGQVRHIWSRVVYEGEPFEVQEGVDRYLRHTQLFETEDPTKIVKVYAMARFADGNVDWEVMTRAQVEAIRARSKQANGPAWTGSYGQMGRKTVIRRFCNNLTLTPLAMVAISRDDDRAFPPDVKDVTPVEGRASSRAASIRERAAVQVVGAPETAQEPVEARERTTPVEAQGAALCGVVSPYDGLTTCELPAAHGGLHRNGDQESWDA